MSDGPFYGVDGSRVLGPFHLLPHAKQALEISSSTHNDEIVVPGSLYRYGGRFIGTAESLAQKKIAFVGRFTPKPADWTVGLTGATNTSPKFFQIASEVNRLIRSNGTSLIQGESEGVARLIVAHLAHHLDMEPRR